MFLKQPIVMAGTWSLGGVENENTGDKKADKLAKKQNKKVAKTLKKEKKLRNDGQIDGMQVRGVFGSRDGFFSPTKMWKPWKKPVNLFNYLQRCNPVAYLIYQI